MDFQLLTIDKNNQDSFFYNLEVGDIFKFEISGYIWEDIFNIAVSQGKKVKKININNFLYNIAGSGCGIVIRDIKEAAENIRDEELLRLQGELSKCYKRIDNLETTLGIRGVERLSRCEICKENVLPYQSIMHTDTGVEHVECNLNNIIKDLTKSINKKDETLKKWVKDSQRLGSENQSLRIEKDSTKDVLLEIQSEINILTLLNEGCNNRELEYKNIIKNIENENYKKSSIIKELENINNVQEDLLKGLLVLIIRVMRLLGDNSNNDFIPIPVVNLTGEQRTELRGWCKPLFDDLYAFSNSIKECL